MLVKYLGFYFKRDIFFKNYCNEKCMPDLYFDIMAYFYVLTLCGYLNHVLDKGLSYVCTFCVLSGGISVHRNVTWQHQHPLFVPDTAAVVTVAEVPNTCSGSIL